MIYIIFIRVLFIFILIRANRKYNINYIRVIYKYIYIIKIKETLIYISVIS